MILKETANVLGKFRKLQLWHYITLLWHESLNGASLHRGSTLDHLNPCSVSPLWNRINIDGVWWTLIMPNHDLSRHNYSFVVQYECNNSLYHCSLKGCSEERLCQNLPDSYTKTTTATDKVKCMQLQMKGNVDLENSNLGLTLWMCI